MKKILGFILCFTVLVGCSIKQPSAPIVDTDQKTKDVMIQWINLYQVLLEWSEVDYTWSKMLIGCNDSLVAIPVTTSIKESDKISETRKLLTSYDAEDKWFTNPWIGQDAIQFQSYELQANKIIIKLSWSLKIDWTCDVPRLEESVKSTYKAFWFEEVELLVNGKKINDQ